MASSQETGVKVLHRDLKLACAVAVDNAHEIRTQFLDGAAHTVHAVVVRGDHEWAHLAMADARVPRQSCHS